MRVRSAGAGSIFHYSKLRKNVKNHICLYNNLRLHIPHTIFVFKRNPEITLTFAAKSAIMAAETFLFWKERRAYAEGMQDPSPVL